MAIVIKIPTSLRKATQGESQVKVEAKTVKAAFSELTSHHGEISNSIFDDDGNVRRFVNIFVNEEDIRFLDELDTKSENGDVISIIPAVA